MIWALYGGGLESEPAPDPPAPSNPNNVIFQANRNTNQSLTANVTAIDWNSIDVDTESGHLSGVYTVVTAGLHIIAAVVRADGAFSPGIYVDGGEVGEYFRFGTHGDDNDTQQVCFVDDFVSDQTIEVRVNGNTTVLGGVFDYANHITILRI